MLYLRKPLLYMGIAQIAFDPPPRAFQTLFLMDAMTKEMRTEGLHQITKHPGKRSDPSPTPQKPNNQEIAHILGRAFILPTPNRQ